MTPLDINYRLRLSGLRHKDVAKKLGLNNANRVCKVINGHEHTPRIQSGIAEILGLPVEEVFPVAPQAVGEPVA